MPPQVNFLWLVAGSVLITSAILGFAGYLVSSNRQEAESRRKVSQAENEKREVEQRLHESKRKEVIGALVGGMAFLINDLLFTIKELIAELQAETDPTTELSLLGQSIHETIRSAQYVSDRLYLVTHPDELDIFPTSVAELFSSINAEISAQLSGGVKLTTEFQHSNDTILGNESLLSQVILNLVTNAVDAMPDGGELTISLSNVKAENLGAKFDLDSLDEYILIRVADTGIGIEETNLKRVFEPFFTTNGSPNRLGLGLSISFGIVRMHRGLIDIESRKNAGTTASIYLPLATQGQIADVYAGNPGTSASYIWRTGMNR